MENLDILKKKILVLTETIPEIDPMFEAWKNYGLNADLLFKPVKSKWVRALRRLWLGGILPGASFWYGDWKKDILDYDMIILHASELTRTMPRWIHKQRKDIRVIYWYWNPVNEQSLPTLINDDSTEIWSFDAGDCQKYDMKQNIQYYYEDKNNTDSDIEYDVYFVGHDKGRLAQINALKEIFDAQDITYRFDIIKESEPNVPYKEVRKRIRKSRAILEITQSGQKGCTLRALEALFFNKKLITANTAVVNEDFYNKDNIYIVDDECKGIKEFLDSQMVDMSQYKKRYDIDAWLENFILDRN